MSPSVELSISDLCGRRTQAQRLAARLPREALIDAVRAVCGVNAQLRPAMMLALRARIADLKPDDVEEAIRESRSLVRIWAMRGTLHLLAAGDVCWLVALLGPVFAAQGKGRRLALGLDEDTIARGLIELRSALANGKSLTRGELVEALAERGIGLDRRSQAPIHLIGYAALDGVVCLGPDRQNGESTYVLLDRWVDSQQPVARETALAALARRYLQGYGPASPRDFAAWSGLTLGNARRGWTHLQEQGELVELSVDGSGLWTLAANARPTAPLGSAPTVRLLPAFDTYLLGYSNRSAVVHPDDQGEVYHGGQVAPVVLVDGAAAGVWRYERRGKRLDISIRPFTALEPGIQRLIAEEADDIGRFFDLPVAVNIAGNT